MTRSTECSLCGHFHTAGPCDLAHDGVEGCECKEVADDLPTGYRWANEEETENPPAGAILVPLTTDSTGRPYAQDEADLAVPTEGPR